jgi:hypothetical protein
MHKTILLITAAAVIAGTGANAQGGGPPPEVMAKLKKWQTWRDNNKYITSLQQTVMGFAEIEKDAKTRLTKEQARKILPVLKEWATKPTMSNDEAKEVNKKITDPLTVAQLAKISTVKMPSGRGFGGGSRSNQPAGGGGRPGFDISKFPDPRAYNPLNFETNPFKVMMPEARVTEIKQKNAEFMKTLAERAK